MSENHYFNTWWAVIGLNIPITEGNDYHEHAREVACAAWEACNITHQKKDNVIKTVAEELNELIQEQVNILEQHIEKMGLDDEQSD